MKILLVALPLSLMCLVSVGSAAEKTPTAAETKQERIDRELKEAEAEAKRLEAEARIEAARRRLEFLSSCGKAGTPPCQ
jgi:hypothetical protein